MERTNSVIRISRGRLAALLAATVLVSVALFSLIFYHWCLHAKQTEALTQGDGPLWAFEQGELEVVEEKEAGDGSFKLVYLGDGGTGFRLELTWLRDRTEPYNLGECEFHLAFVTDQYQEFYEKHKAMGCICFENPAMGIYFISDPDGYWIEIIPTR